MKIRIKSVLIISTLSIFIAFAAFSIILTPSIGSAEISNPPVFSLPIKCNLGADCFIMHYFDLDPGREPVDFGCGRQTYSNHNGTDFGIADLESMKRGVSVLAAAAGIVLRVRDGTADFEYTEGSISKFIGDSIRSIYRGLRLPINLLLGAIDGNGAACPTYGLWGGAGWNAGTRTPEGEEDKRGQVFAWLMLVPRNIRRNQNYQNIWRGFAQDENLRRAA